MQTHLTRDTSNDLYTIFKFYTKHCITETFYHGAILLNRGLLRHMSIMNFRLKIH